MSRTTSIRSIAKTALVALWAASIASTGASLSLAAESDPRADLRAAGPGSVFHSVQAAALAALTHAHLTATPRDRQRLRAGTIYRVADGYSYTAPQRSAASSPLMRQSVRFSLRSIDVASYLVESRSAATRSNGSNESPSENQRRIVDELDPAHRPLYVLMPSLDIVRYSQGRQLRVISSAKDRKPAKQLTTVTTAKTQLALDDVICAKLAFPLGAPSRVH
jgi:hypothetical protein